ncbi:MAG: ribbon-helix-helix domain-containing protein [bacterium]
MSDELTDLKLVKCRFLIKPIIIDKPVGRDNIAVIQTITVNMREIINISLPKEMVSAVERIMKEESFATKSEFFRHLLRLKIEGATMKEIIESRRELESGKGKLLTSLAKLEK